MSTLHKVFTVLLSVLCIAFAMQFITFAAQTSNWKELAQTYQQEALVSDTHQRNLIASQAAQMAAALDARESLLAAKADVERQLQSSVDEVNRMKAESAQLQAEKAGEQTSNRILLGEVKVAQNGWQEERTQRETLEQRNLELEKRNIDLAGRVNELSAHVLVLVQEKRQFEQENNLLRSENEKLAGTHARPPSGSPEVAIGPGMDQVDPRTAAERDVIRGHIVDVKGKFATISVGSADGVKSDMTFVIYRGRDYIGELKISEVEPNLAGGTLTRTRSVPQVNDTVADETGFSYSG